VRLFGLIGYPLSHSFSEKYFAEKFQREGITDALYKAFPLTDVGLVTDLIKSHPDLKGFNVTIPYKEAIIPLLTELDTTAQAVGAVNCIRVTHVSHLPSPVLTGYNTDVHGFRQSLKPFLASHHERALILGTGGASKAVEHVLRTIGVECVFVSRSSTLDSTRSDKDAGRMVLSYSDLNEHVMRMCKLIVNCTPVGTFPDAAAAPEIPYAFVTEHHFLYDLVYNPAETEFLKRGKAKGALTLNGMDMLKMQAEAAWQIWNQE
jgi:shikimate dehydrogenase